ncbi:MAG: type I glyceraldehyde-3-phosphate dehydrogenase [Nanoarchaeota archaeon]|nr:type I glyceraldehyde-3-phosphate dehydrogenase [Nanoarchaeota archaeon]
MVNVAINGFGRIGKQFFLAALEQNLKWNFYINSIGTLQTMIYSLKYDSVHPSFKDNISTDGKNLIVKNKKIPVFEILDPQNLPWKKEKIDLVVDCTGAYTDRVSASKHLQAGAKKVLISAPAKNPDCTIVHGVNNSAIKSNHQIVSTASCTTNCICPMLKVLHDNFKILNAHFITAHAYTATQGLIDREDKKDVRRGRAAAINIVPSTSGATNSVLDIFPELKGKIGGYALRVPVIDGSITHVVAKLKNKVTKEQINSAFKKSSQTNLKGILEYSQDPLVSSDIIHNPNSCIFDSQLTEVVDELISISGWYDNEWGYSNRLVDVAKLMVK